LQIGGIGTKPALAAGCLSSSLSRVSGIPGSGELPVVGLQPESENSSPKTENGSELLPVK